MPAIAAGTNPRPLDRLVLRNVRCFDAATIPLDPRVTVLIGDNGTGKTTVAEAIASLVAGEGEGLERFPLRHGATDGLVELVAGGETVAHWSKGPEGGQRERLPEETHVFAFGRYRRIELPPAAPTHGPVLLGPEWKAYSQSPLRENLSQVVYGRRTVTLYRPDEILLRGLDEYWLALREQESVDARARAAMQRLSEVLAEPSIGIEGLDVAVRDDRQVPVLRRAGGSFTFGELSDGYQSILAILLDLVLRYLFLFGTRDNPLDGMAIVVVDEVDLHLHPRWQRAVVGQLTRLFPNTQFILTTHSPAIVQGAIDFRHTVVALRPGELGEGGERRIRVEALPRARRRRLVGAGIGSVMVDDELFHVASRYSEKYDHHLRVVESLREQVHSGVASAAERRRYLSSLEMLQLLLAAEEERRGEGFMAELAAAQLGFLRKMEAAIEKGGADGPPAKKRSARTGALEERRRR